MISLMFLLILKENKVSHEEVQELLWSVPGPPHKLRQMRELPAPEVLLLEDFSKQVSTPSADLSLPAPTCLQHELAECHPAPMGLSMGHKPTI